MWRDQILVSELAPSRSRMVSPDDAQELSGGIGLEIAWYRDTPFLQ